MKISKFLFLISFCIVLSFSCGEDDGPTDPNPGPSGTTPNVSITSVTKFEGNENGEFEFNVRLSTATTNEVTVDYTTNDKSAVEGEDYTGTSGTLTFAANETDLPVTVEIIADTLKEGDEEFEVVISNPLNANLSSSSTGIGTIRNDDTFLAVEEAGYITPESYAGMTLVWRDEFNGTEIDADSWKHELGNSGWGNNELQNYTASSTNSFVSNGLLTIEAREEASNGSNYSSARMITAGLKEFQYGRVDIRARLPEGQGIWPALWMLGANIFEIGWPACGEIDIMELVGHEPNVIHGTGHWGVQGSGTSTFQGNGFTLSGGAKYSDEFNVFSIVWTQNQVKYLMNDQEYFALTQGSVGGLYPFNSPFFFIFNIAVGGNWPGSPDATTVFPQRMFVDYIRVFQ